MKSRTTFRAFTDSYASIYKRGKSPASFMSVQTFINWFFGWASRMRLEFREKCEFCPDGPLTLACDGTKIGINFKNAFVTAIETPESNEMLQNHLRRLDRCFIKTMCKKEAKKASEARSTLSTLSSLILKGSPTLDVVDDELLRFIPEKARDALIAMVKCKGIVLKKSYAKVFRLLSSVASVTALLPLDFAGRFDRHLQINDVILLEKYCPEIANLLTKSNRSDDVISLIECLCEMVKTIHTKIQPAGDPIPILSTYNPPKHGRAYYFEGHGCQLRQVRPFDIDLDGTTKKNFDDVPDEVCEKRFPDVSKKGTTYLFLFFCPIHGHCYGYHIIPFSEGRKDPSAALYTHLATPPESVFYDFSCSLSEYCLNRESGYFANTRFFHDVFHGYTHKCSQVFKSNRLRHYDQINSSICEQFNSFLQCVKSSAKLMTQTHFSFFLQFFIYMWNAKKKRSFQGRLNIAEDSKK